MSERSSPAWGRVIPHGGAPERQPTHYGMADRESQREHLETIAGFWTDLYSSVSDGPRFLALFCGARPTPDAKLAQPSGAYFRWPQELSQALAWVARQAAEERELYQGAALTTRWRRRKEDIAPCTAVWVDLDHDKLTTDQVAPPSIVVESSPGRLQCYWQLVAPVPPAMAEHVNRQLALLLHADPSGWDATQLLRIPTTTNFKYAAHPAVRLIAQTERRYTLEQLTNPFADLPLFAARAPAPDAAAQGAAAFSPDRLSRAGRKVWEGLVYTRKPDGTMDRSASLVRLARVLFNAGASRDQIIATLAERDVSLRWGKYSGREDAKRQYEAIAALIAQSSPPTRAPH